MTRNPHRARPIAGVLAVFLLVAPFLLAPAKAQSCAGVKDLGDWSRIEAPSFEVGPRKISAYGYARSAGGRFIATNGISVSRTSDGGCTWKKAYSLPSGTTIEPNRDDSTIVEIDADPTGGTILLLVQVNGGGVVRPHVVRSVDSGETWSAADAGLSPAGSPEFLTVAPTDPNLVFLGVDVGSGEADLLYASTDGGATWLLRSDLSRVTDHQGIYGLEVDPGDASSVWAHGEGGLYHSSNGGASFTVVDELAGEEVVEVDLFSAGGAPAEVTAFRAGSGDMMRSKTEGETWLAYATPDSVTSAAHGETAEDLVITAGGKVWGFHPPSLAWFDIFAPAPGVSDVGAATGGSAYYGRTEAALFVYRGQTGVSLVTPPGVGLIDLPGIGFPLGLPASDPALGPDDRRIEIPVGETKTVTYTFDLPQRKVPLDLFFLVDTTESMESVITELARSLRDIADALANERLAARFGLAELRAYPDRAVPQQNDYNFVYRLRNQLSDDPSGLLETLENLSTLGGGRYEGNLGALEQIATGAGAQLDALNSIPRNQEADFRDNALRVVLHATNSQRFSPPEATGFGFGRPTPPDVPTFAEVANQLNAKQIEHVGLAVGRDPRLSKKPLKAISRSTDSRAPDGGVDCDDDGAIDILPQRPLVCQLKRGEIGGSTNLVPAIVNLINGIQTRTDAKLRVTEGLRVVDGVSPEIYPSIVEQTVEPLSFDVTFRCPRGLAGQKTEVSFDALTGGAAKASASAIVECTDEIAPPLPVLGPIIALFALPPAPPPPPVYSQAPQAQAQSQSQAQAQGAMAAQEQEEPQLATVTANDPEPQGEESYAMSAYRPSHSDSPSPVALYIGAAAAMTVAFSVATARRDRTQKVWNRR